MNVETGIVEYELVDYDYYVGDEQWDRINHEKPITCKNDDYFQGVVLFQLIEDRQLKVEIFPGKTADEVNGFTENYKIYGR